MVVKNPDVRRYETGDPRIGAAEKHIVAGSFQVIVDDHEGTRSIPPGNCLRVTVRILEVGQIRVDDRCPAGIQGDAAPRTTERVAVNVALVEDQMMREVRCARFAGSELDQIESECARYRKHLHSA